MNYAVIDQSNTVVNTVVLEEGSTWLPPENHTIVPLKGFAGIGWTWDGSNFIAPPKKEPTPE